MKKNSTLSKILSLTPKVSDSTPKTYRSKSGAYVTHGGKSTQEIAREKRMTKVVRTNSPEYDTPTQAVAYELAMGLRYQHQRGSVGNLLAEHLLKTSKKTQFSKARYAEFLAKSYILPAALTYYRSESEARKYATPSVRRVAGEIFVDSVLDGEWAPERKNPPLRTHVQRGECKPTAKGKRVLSRRNPSRVTKALLEEYVLDYQGKKYKVRWTPEEKKIFAYLWMNHTNLAKHVLESPASKHGNMLREFVNTGDIDEILARRYGAIPKYTRDSNGKITGLANVGRYDAIFGKRQNPTKSRTLR